MEIDIKHTDELFDDSPDVGPDCKCSRCGKPILEGPAIRGWPGNNLEYRFHPECLGMNMPKYYDGDFDDNY